jgi:hypothetical protein
MVASATGIVIKQRKMVKHKNAKANIPVKKG